MLNLGNVFILGDSYSTFAGHIPEGYAPYYPHEDIDVDCVEKTWWHRMLSETTSELLLNNSWSGTTLCHTGYNGSDCKNISFAARLDKLIDEGYFEQNKVDTFLLFGGTNDSWANSPIGEFKGDNITQEDIYSVLPAMEHICASLKNNLPCTKIVCVINVQLKQEIKDAFAYLCEKYGFVCAKLKDLDLVNGHPTSKGMEQIKDQILDSLK